MTILTSEQLREDFHYLYLDELPALKQLVRSLPANPLVINIGAGAGTSGLAILESRDDVALVTIDIQDESSPFGCLEAERDVIKRAGFAHKAFSYWRQLQGDSVEIGLNFIDTLARYADAEFPTVLMARFYRYADMVFVDGDHSYEHARDDIQIWLRLLRDGGIIAVHDYRKEDLDPQVNGPHPKPWPGVDQAVVENLLSVYPTILHVDSLIAFRKELL